MSGAPSSAREFFETYLPAWFKSSAGSAVTSPGSLMFHVGSDSYALRLVDGALQVASGPATDAILQVSLSPADFAELVRQGEVLFANGAGDRLLALRALSLDAERAQLIRNVDGSVAFEVSDGDQLRALLLSPGAAVVGASPPACTVRVLASDFWALSRGEKNPFELLMDGKIRMQGRMEVAMAFSSVMMG